MSIKILIIGGGPAGYVCALHAADHGADVTLIEKQNLGGTCLNRGCIPSKIMKDAADTCVKISRADQYGINLEIKTSMDMNVLNHRKHTIIAQQQQGIASLLHAKGIHIINGTAVVKSLGSVQVVLENGDTQDCAYDRLILATGTRPLSAGDFLFDHKHILSSDDVLSLEKIPESIVIVGGGVIGCEFACILSALGSDVTVIEAMSRLLPLPSIDPECSKLLLREMKKQKIKVYCDTLVRSIEKNEAGVRVHTQASSISDNASSQKNKNPVIDAQKIAFCIGRKPDFEDLGLENIGLSLSEKGWMNVNEKMETCIKNVYAIGDILGPEKYMLAHVAYREGMIAAQNATGRAAQMSYRVIPNTVFTIPEIACVGLTLAQAQKENLSVQSYSVNFRNLGKAHITGEIAGFAKIVIDASSHKVLGVQIMGAHASELISGAALAVQNDLSVKDVAQTLFAHPTMSEILGEVSLKATGRAIHG
ncbi:MAG: dihydrolipoyl dehydrogenase [Proteobacteria bacterium]|nr:dihydrolipoyl dehydrogenase [Pseudomonadota bacterium]MBU1389205.1 dihydrolipoyl dehydrogenase [Pseudomonadota bacterium]MBU1543429.1 dihydrolipoyl dehydrogenase [Pseudomonadota bacterium]MBU2429113.1 dihydrolipoyl dehydrogenase [Pseudomonadota bacterium]MBU2480240.1 dihydrolipoyl dehydrogenase [Pseudomonadota bacterium]